MININYMLFGICQIYVKSLEGHHMYEERKCSYLEFIACDTAKWVLFWHENMHKTRKTKIRTLLCMNMF